MKVCMSVDWLANLVEVMEGWRGELPRTKYSDQCHKDIDTFLQDAKGLGAFLADVKDWDLETMGDDGIMDIEGQLRDKRNELGKWWKMVQSDVEFLMGRSSPRSRKLKREGSDVPDPEAPNGMDTGKDKDDSGLDSDKDPDKKMLNEDEEEENSLGGTDDDDDDDDEADHVHNSAPKYRRMNSFSFE